MKKMTFSLKIAIFAVLPLLLLVVTPPLKIEQLHPKELPAVAETHPAQEPCTPEQLDTGYPGFINSRIIVINY